MTHLPQVHPPLPIDVRARLRAALAVAALLGCSSPQTMEATIPPAARPLWDQCSASISAWCHRQGGGDPTLDRECEETSAREFRALGDDAARRRYLSGRGCAL